LIYLDNAATTFPKSRHVLEKMLRTYLETGVSPGRGGYDLAVLAGDRVDRARFRIARFFGAPDPDRVVFCANATDGLNLALLGWLRPGAHVVTTRLEHNSVLRPLHHLQQSAGVSATFIPFDGQGFVDPEDIARAIRPETTLVVVNHVSNVLGTIQPVAQVGEICLAHGVPLLVDASQSAGQIPVDMARMKASAIVFTGHKALYGPSGIGGLVVHPDLDIRPTRFGGTGVESKSPVHTARFPHRLEAGTHNLMGIIGLSMAIDDLVEIGLFTIHEREMTLFEKLAQGLAAVEGVTLYGVSDRSRQVALVSVNIDGIAPEDVAAILDADFGICVRAGLHCAPLVHASLGTGDRGTVRFSLGRFNTQNDVDRAVSAMAAIAAQVSR
jgi:cysteine desulfurase family protein